MDGALIEAQRQQGFASLEKLGKTKITEWAQPEHQGVAFAQACKDIKFLHWAARTKAGDGNKKALKYYARQRVLQEEGPEGLTREGRERALERAKLVEAEKLARASDGTKYRDIRDYTVKADKEAKSKHKRCVDGKAEGVMLVSDEEEEGSKGNAGGLQLVVYQPQKPLPLMAATSLSSLPRPSIKQIVLMEVPASTLYAWWMVFKKLMVKYMMVLLVLLLLSRFWFHLLMVAVWGVFSILWEVLTQALNQVTWQVDLACLAFTNYVKQSLQTTCGGFSPFTSADVNTGHEMAEGGMWGPPSTPTPPSGFRPTHVLLGLLAMYLMHVPRQAE